MKKTISVLLFLCLAFAFASCNNTSAYRDDIACEALAVNAEKKVNLKDTLAFVEEGDMTLSVLPHISEAVATATDSKVRFTGGFSFDEYGIFHCTDSAAVEKVQKNAKDYVKSRAEDTLYRSYFPGEEYKLDEAEVKVFGNYVVFAILSSENRSAFFAEIEQLLKDV